MCAQLLGNLSPKIPVTGNSCFLKDDYGMINYQRAGGLTGTLKGK